MKKRSSPLVPAYVDLRNNPLPRELFARMAVEQFGIDYATALKYANESADRVEAARKTRRRQ